MIRPRAKAILLLAAATAACAVMPGCIGITTTRVAAADDRGIVEVAPVKPDAWPGRLRTENGRLGIIQPVRGPWLRSGRLPAGQYLEPGQAHAADARALASAAGLKEPERFEFEGPGSLIFQPTDRIPDLAAGQPAALFRFVSAEPGVAQDPEDAPGQPPLLIQRTWFAYFPAKTESTRALALLMPGMLGTPAGLVDQLAGELTADGYAVLRMMAHPSRFTERATLTITPDLEASAQAVADVMTGRAAEAAYAVEAATDHLYKLEPGLKNKPRIAIGMSGGAMIMTTVMARQPENWAAGVSIAGGANFWAVHDRSNYAPFIGAFGQRWQELTPDEQTRQRFAQVYLDNAPLDSYHAARAVARVPFLMIHGSSDRAVPADLGDQLWEQLGKPDRWSTPVGHELLFWFLPKSYPDILLWLDQHVPGGERNLGGNQ